MSAIGKTRDRAPRNSLNRERIVKAALRIVDEEGVEGLSMPKLARGLNVGVMSLYSHIESKDDLLDALVEAVLSEIPPPRGDSWREALASHFATLRRALLDHPGLGEVLARKNVAVPAVFEILEANLSLLADAGLEDEECVTTYYTLLAFTLGFVAWELPRTHVLTPTEYQRRWRVAAGGLDPTRYPTVRGMASALAGAASEEQFMAGIDRLLGRPPAGALST